MKWLWALLLLTGCSGAVHLENDIGVPFRKTEDKYFTHGTKFSYFSEADDQKEKETYSLGQNIYTPFRKKPDAPRAELEKDRPYAGWTYGEYRNTKYKSETLKDTWGFQLGCTGPCSFAKQTQQQVHRWLDQTVPEWTRDFTQHSEPGIILELERNYLLAKNQHADFATYGALKAGNIIDSAAFGLDARVGYNLDRFASEPIVFKVPRSKPSPWMAYVFGRAEERLVAYNHFLDGSLFRSERHEVDSEPSVQELDAGITLGYEKFKFTYRYTLFANEWSGQGGRIDFGGIDLNW